MIVYPNSILSGGVLNRRFLQFLLRLGCTGWGAGLTAAGILFAFWARYHIGRYWSSKVIALRSGHKIIRTGPYRTYSSPDLHGSPSGASGPGVVAIGECRALLGFAIPMLITGFTVKAKKEEALLACEFGPSISANKRRHTGFFLKNPKLILIARPMRIFPRPRSHDAVCARRSPSRRSRTARSRNAKTPSCNFPVPASWRSGRSNS